ncbi:MAG: hypothetical protein K8S99_13400 [Planctomycetes bacterium]|nr:hypothetical protein [Planctomycetota bacterium]
MKAGFARACINPPLGTHLYGFGGRDRDGGATSIHDDIFARALYLSHGGEETLIMGFDLLFFSRAQADRFKGAIGARLDLSPRQILLNTSHTHAGPMLGHGTWCYADYLEPDRLYLDQLEHATIEAAKQAKASARDVTVWSGSAQTRLPVNRRKPDGTGSGRVIWAPYHDGAALRTVPFTLFKDRAGSPVCFLFSVSCHPSSIGGYDVSADYPGLAMDLIDKHLGATCSLFLQGAGGDTKAIYTDKGDHFQGSWEAVENGGKLVASDVITALARPLTQIDPALNARMVEMRMELENTPDRAQFERDANDPKAPDWHRLWAQRQVAKIDRNMLPRDASVIMHGIEIGGGLRIVGVEAEIVAEIGELLVRFYADGLTYPLGYTDGTQFYLPTSKMIEREGGYEVDSIHEYGHPAKLRTGVEGTLTQAMEGLFTGV